MIQAYLEELASTLRFDRALSRCVVGEVEDHLREAVAADPAPDRLAAERRAIMNFGEPRLLAAQFAVVSLARRTRRLGIAVVLAVVAVLVAMKARVAWYSALQWSMSEDARPLAAIVLTVDRLRAGLRRSSGSERCCMPDGGVSRADRDIAGSCAARVSCVRARSARSSCR